MKVTIPVMEDATLYTCDGQIAVDGSEPITADTLIPCMHGHGIRIVNREFDSLADFEKWLEGNE